MPTSIACQFFGSFEPQASTGCLRWESSHAQSTAQTKKPKRHSQYNSVAPMKVKRVG